MKRYIRSTTDDSVTKFTIDDIKRALRSLRDQDCKVFMKGDSVRVTTYERDYVTFAHLSDLLSYMNNLSNPDLEYDISDALYEVGEGAGYHHAAEIPMMRERTARLQKKYFDDNVVSASSTSGLRMTDYQLERLLDLADDMLYQAYDNYRYDDYSKKDIINIVIEHVIMVITEMDDDSEYEDLVPFASTKNRQFMKNLEEHVGEMYDSYDWGI